MRTKRRDRLIKRAKSKNNADLMVFLLTLGVDGWYHSQAPLREGTPKGGQPEARADLENDTEKSRSNVKKMS